MSSNQMQNITKAVSQLSFTPIQGSSLQRKCACGQHTFSGGECEECRQKREGTLQRAAVSAAMANVNQKVADDQQQWLADAQKAQDAIDPFKGAQLNCP